MRSTMRSTWLLELEERHDPGQSLTLLVLVDRAVVALHRIDALEFNLSKIANLTLWSSCLY